MIGCHKVGIKQICFFDAFSKNQSNYKDSVVGSVQHPHLTYFNDLNENAKVSISYNLKKFCFVNGDENFILEIEESKNKNAQNIYT